MIELLRKNESERVSVTEMYFVMPDGVKLYTRLAVPKNTNRCPIVYVRTPYDKPLDGTPFQAKALDNDPFIGKGYALVRQHVRGKGDSEGDCMPYSEREDGIAAYRMLRELPCYNGEIFLMGGSYLSTVHLICMDAFDSDVKGAALDIQADRMYIRNWRNGCSYNFSNIGWWLSMLSRRYPNQTSDGILHRPYRDIMMRAVGKDVPEFTGCLIHEENDEFWTSDPRNYAMESVKFPLLLTEGWYDFYLEGMFDMWRRIPDEISKKCAYVVGPWGHATREDQPEYPMEHHNLPYQHALEWFEHIRRGDAYRYAEEGKITCYSIGGDRWFTADDPADPARERLYFDASHRLLTCVGEGEISYTYDPDKRVGCFPYMKLRKCAAPDSVDGVISFLSEPVTNERRYFGRICWHMRVRSDCEDTAFFIRVYFVDSRESYNLTETIARLTKCAPDYRPGETACIDLTLPEIAFTLKPGMRLRVDIASDGGIYVPHPNTREPFADALTVKIAHNTIICDGSYIELPLENTKKPL